MSNFADIQKRGFPISITWEAIAGHKPTRKPIYAKRSRFWLYQRRITNTVVFWLLAWAERKGFIERAWCHECAGAPEGTADDTYIAGWEDCA